MLRAWITLNRCNTLAITATLLSLVVNLVATMGRDPSPDSLVSAWRVESVNFLCTAVTNVDRRLASGNFVYIGDTRARLLYLAHQRALRANSTWISSTEERLLHGCPSGVKDNFKIQYVPCKEIQEKCLQKSVEQLTYVDVLIVALGLHDALKRDGVSQRRHDFSLITTQAQELTPRQTIWVPPHSLIPPISHSFHMRLSDSVDRINYLVKEWSVEFVNFLIAAGYDNNTNIFHMQELLEDCGRVCNIYTGRTSTDGVDYWDEVYDYAIHQIAWIDASGGELEARNSAHASSAFVPGDWTCGSEDLSSLVIKDELQVASFGGSVTSDGLYVNSFAKHLANITGQKVNVHNFGEPATDSTYQSLCLEHTLNSTEVQFDLVLVEYCVNDMRHPDVSLKQLMIKLISLNPSSAAVMYYCHRAPRNIFGGELVDSHWNMTRDLGLIGYRSKSIINSVLRSRSEAELFYRDDVHLSQQGADVIGNILATGLLYCASQTGSSVVTPKIDLGATTQGTLDHSPVAIESADVCFTALGPNETRNLAQVVEVQEGWEFVEHEHRSAPNGKNGYESITSGACMHVNINISSCANDVYMFYLYAGDEDMGIVELSLEYCPSFSQQLNGYSGLGFAVTEGRKIEIIPSCCEKLRGNQLLRVCSAQRAGQQSHPRFRIIALATRIAARLRM